MKQKATIPHKENIGLYFVYAAAAYFGLQFFLKSSKGSPAATVERIAAGPPPVPVAVPQTVPSAMKAPAHTPAVKTTWIAEAMPLRMGMKGPKVKILQQKLGISADGAFGKQTQSALISKYRVATVSQSLFQNITGGSAAPTKKTQPDTSPVLKTGSRGAGVYRLQKWLGFKDKKSAKAGEPVADSLFGKQTATALQKRTGQPFISVGHFNAISAKGTGIADWLLKSSGMAGHRQPLVCSIRAVVLDQDMLPVSTAPARSRLGIPNGKMRFGADGTAYTGFWAAGGMERWVRTTDL